MRNKSVEDFKKAVQEKDIECWPIRSCCMCGYELEYIFLDGSVYFDVGCDCASVGVKERSWEDVAELYNMQTNSDVMGEMDEFWGFNKDVVQL